jgi:hypothetical protein
MRQVEVEAQVPLALPVLLPFMLVTEVTDYNLVYLVHLHIMQAVAVAQVTMVQELVV